MLYINDLLPERNTYPGKQSYIDHHAEISGDNLTHLFIPYTSAKQNQRFVNNKLIPCKRKTRITCIIWLNLNGGINLILFIKTERKCIKQLYILVLQNKRETFIYGIDWLKCIICTVQNSAILISLSQICFNYNIQVNYISVYLTNCQIC